MNFPAALCTQNADTRSGLEVGLEPAAFLFFFAIFYIFFFYLFFLSAAAIKILTVVFIREE